MKFHVGDRWADQDGCEWLLFWTNGEDEVRACNKIGRVEIFRYGRSLSGVVLTRLISSERWIPFAEMMPEEPVLDKESRSLLIYRKATDVQVLDAFGNVWHDVGGRTLKTWVTLHRFTHWRYLLTPEASC